MPNAPTPLQAAHEFHLKVRHWEEGDRRGAAPRPGNGFNLYLYESLALIMGACSCSFREAAATYFRRLLPSCAADRVTQ